MKIIKDTCSMDELKVMAKELFGDMVKGVVDIDKEWVAVNAELHADLEALLLEEGSNQKDLWGINLYPDMQGDDFIEFDSMINIRPSQGNMSRGVNSLEIQEKIRSIVNERIEL